MTVAQDDIKKLMEDLRKNVREEILDMFEKEEEEEAPSKEKAPLEFNLRKIVMDEILDLIWDEDSPLEFLSHIDEDVKEIKTKINDIYDEIIKLKEKK